MKKKYIFMFIGLFIVFTICIPVFALDGKSNYKQKVSGNSIFLSLGNIGNVNPNTDVTIPVIIGGSNYSAHSIRLSFDYDTEYFDFVSIDTGSASNCNSSSPFYLSNDDDENGTVSAVIMCVTQGSLSSHGNLLNLKLHTKNNFSGNHYISITVNELYSYPVGAGSKRDLPYVTFNGMISSGKVYNTITFIDWNGLVLDTQVVESNNTIIAPPSPHRRGYTFTGWSENINNINSNVLVIAQYQVNS